MGFCRPESVVLFPRGIRDGVPATGVSTKDDRLILIAISALACILQDVLHEGVGHGATAWLSGAHRLTMSTVALQSDIGTRLISARRNDMSVLLWGACTTC